MEVIFIIDMTIQVLVEHYDEVTLKVEKDVVELTKIYLKGRFSIDLVAVFPFIYIFD